MEEVTHIPDKLQSVVDTVFKEDSTATAAEKSIMQYVFEDVLGESKPTCEDGKVKTVGAPLSDQSKSFIGGIEDSVMDLVLNLIQNLGQAFRTGECPAATDYKCVPALFQQYEVLKSLDDALMVPVNAVGNLLYDDSTPLTSKAVAVIPNGISELSAVLSAPMESFAVAFYLQFLFVFVGSACLLTFAYSWINIKRVEKKRSKQYRIPENADLNVPMVGGVGWGLCGKRGCCESKKLKKARGAGSPTGNNAAIVPAAAAQQGLKRTITPAVSVSNVQVMPDPMLQSSVMSPTRQEELLAEQSMQAYSQYNVGGFK